MTVKIKNTKPLFIITMSSLVLISITILLVLLISNEFNFSKFDWSSLSGVSNTLTTLITLVLLLSIWQAKDAHNESTKARVQSTNASDAEVLRWAMKEIGESKSDIKLVTEAYKKDLVKILIDNHGYSCNNNDNDNDNNDKSYMDFIRKLEGAPLKKFHEDVEGITGESWDSTVTDVLHTKVSIIMQRMGYMALFGLISKQHFINLWGPMFLASWYSIEWYIKAERERLSEDSSENWPPEKFIKAFGNEDSNRNYEGAFFRIHLETFIVECENKLPLKLVNNERLKFGRTRLEK